MSSRVASHRSGCSVASAVVPTAIWNVGQHFDVHDASSMWTIDRLMRCTASTSSSCVGARSTLTRRPGRRGASGATEGLDQLAEQVSGLVEVGDAFGPQALPSPVEQRVALHAAVEVRLQRAPGRHDATAADRQHTYREAVVPTRSPASEAQHGQLPAERPSVASGTGGAAAGSRTEPASRSARLPPLLVCQPWQQ